LGVRYYLHWRIQPYVGISLGKNHYKEEFIGVISGGLVSTGWDLFLNIEPGIRYYIHKTYFNIKFSPLKHKEPDVGVLSHVGFVLSIGQILN